MLPMLLSAPKVAALSKATPTGCTTRGKGGSRPARLVLIDDTVVVVRHKQIARLVSRQAEA